MPAVRGWCDLAMCFADWKPYTNPKTGRQGWISDGGLVRYTRPNPDAPEHRDPSRRAAQGEERERARKAAQAVVDKLTWGDEPLTVAELGTLPHHLASLSSAELKTLAGQLGERVGTKKAERAQALYERAKAARGKVAPKPAPKPEPKPTGDRLKAARDRLADGLDRAHDHDEQDPLGHRAAGFPADKVDREAFHGRVAAAVAKWHDEKNALGLQLDEAYHDLGLGSGLSKEEFLRAVTDGHFARQYRLGDWGKTIDEIPDPELTTLIGSSTMFNLYPIRGGGRSPDPKPTIDYQQKDPDHPLAKAIREDAAGRAVLESFLARAGEANRLSDLAGRFKQISDDYWNTDGAHHRATMDYQAAVKNRRTHEYREKLRKKVEELNVKREELKAQRQEAIEAQKQVGPAGRKALLEAAAVKTPSWVQYHEAEPYDGGLYPADPVNLTPERKAVLDEGFQFAARLVGGSHMRHVGIGVSPSGRAYHAGKLVAMGDTFGKIGGGGESELVADYYRSESLRQAVHEIGHHYEKVVPGLKEKAQEFLEYRLAGEKPVKLNTLPGRSQVYGDHEEGAADDFGRVFGIGAHYVGKQYPSGDTEVVSMGLEYLHKDPVKFAREDPEYFQWLLTALRGSE